MSKKVGKLIAEYDIVNIVEEEVAYRKENPEEFEYEGMSDDEMRNRIYNDAEYVFEDAYAYACETIGEVYVRKFKSRCAKIEGRNLDWRNSSGYKYICLDFTDDPEQIGRQLIRELAPRSGEYTFDCFNYGRGLFFRLYHHDCPTGSLFEIMPCAYSTYERYS